MSDFLPILVLQIKICIKPDRHGKGSNKIWETHTFWRHFFNRGAIWLSSLKQRSMMQNRHTRSSSATDLAYMSSVTSGKSSFFVVRICVLPQVALWGKGDGVPNQTIRAFQLSWLTCPSTLLPRRLLLEITCGFGDYIRKLNLRFPYSISNYSFIINSLT